MSNVIQLVLNELIDTIVKKDKNKRKRETTCKNTVPKLSIKKPKIYKMESISSDDFIGSPRTPPCIQRQLSLPLYEYDLPPLDLPPLSLTPSCDFDPSANLCRMTHWRDPDIGIDPLFTAPDGAIGSIFHATDGTKHHFLYGNQTCSMCIRDESI